MGRGAPLLAGCCLLLVAGLVSSAGSTEIAYIKLLCLLKEQTNCSENYETDKAFPSLWSRYSNIPVEIRKVIETEGPSNLSPNILSSLPISLLNLLPDNYLKNLTGSAVAEVIKTHMENEALVTKYLGVLNSKNQQKDFLQSMVNVTMPVKFQEKLVSYMSTWLPLDDWTADDFVYSRNIGNPILAYLPAGILTNVPDKTALKFMLHLNEWKGSHPANRWSDKPQSVKRVWSYLSVRELYPQPLEMWTTRNLKHEGFLLEGATADELKKLNLKHSDTIKLISELQLNKIQVRTLFDMLYGNHSEFTLDNFEELKKFISFLLPTHIQKLALGLADAVILPKIVLQMDHHSLPSMKQLFEYHVAKLLLEGKLENEYPESWKQNITYLSHLAFLLPKRSLKSYSKNNLTIQILSRLSTNKLSRKQAELLSGNCDPKLLLNLKGFIKAVPSSTISTLNIGDLKQDVLIDLISNIATSGDTNNMTDLSVSIRVQILTILQKIRPYLAERSILESIYKSGNPGHFLVLISPKELLELENKLIEKLPEISFQNFAQNSSGFPQNTLSVLLGNARQKILQRNVSWTLDDLAELSNLVLGMTCNDVAVVDTLDILQVLQLYNKYVKFQRMEFPKDMQHCWLKVLPDYFSMKGQIRGHSATADFTEEMERADTYATGGFVLAGLSRKIISQAPERFHILKAIGALSPMALLQAMNNENPMDYAALFVEHYITGHSIQLTDLLNMGTLANFLKVGDIEKIQPKAFKLFLEVIPQENKVLCTSSAAMEAWHSLINKTFGEQGLWSSSTLLSLGGFLAACPHTVLLDVPETSWITTIDVLTSTTNYHKKGKFLGETSDLPFHKMCLKFLEEADHENYVKSVEQLMHLYLIVTQEVMDAVVPAVDIANANKAAVRTKVHNVEFHRVFGKVNEQLTKIEVLNMDEHNRRRRQITLPVFNQPSVPGNTLRAAVINNAHEISGGASINAMSNLTVAEYGNLEDEDSVTDTQKMKIVSNLTCDAIKATGIGAYLGLKEEDIENMNIRETEECLDTFGALDFAESTQNAVWNTLGKGILLKNLLDLGHLVKVMGMNDINGVELNIKNYEEEIAALGEELEDPKLIRILATKWVIDTLNKTLPAEAVGALGNIICGLPTPTITDLLSKDRAFVKLLPVLRNIKGCPMMCLQDLAAIAVRNYGDPRTWSADDISALGVIMAGLNIKHWKSLEGTRGNYPLVGLSSRAVQCLPLNVIKDLTAEQVASLLPSAVAVSEDKFSVLPDQQKEILKKTLGHQVRHVMNKSVRNVVLKMQTVMLTILWFHLIF